MEMKLGRPWLFQIELVEGCNRICTFCGINAIRTAPGNYKYMTEDTLINTVDQIAQFVPEVKIAWAMHGEPTQHPKANHLIGIARSFIPRSQFTLVTNGRVMMGRMQESMDKLWASGIDIIALDTYYPERDELRREARTLDPQIQVIDYYEEKKLMQKVRPFENHHRKLRHVVVLMDDLGARDGDDPTRKVHNHAGGGFDRPALTEPLKKTCQKPFRELAIEWDGTVNQCCEDWLRRYVLGNVNYTTLEVLWHSPEIEAARPMLQNKRRDFAACQVCDAPAGARVGFLPKYPPVTPAQEALVREVERRGGRDDLIQLRTSKVRA